MTDDRFIWMDGWTGSAFGNLVGMIEDEPVLKNNSPTTSLGSSRPAGSAEQFGLGDRLYLWRVVRDRASLFAMTTPSSPQSKNGLDFLAMSGFWMDPTSTCDSHRVGSLESFW